MTTFCAIEPCYLRNRHIADCDDLDCTGCLPGLAGDGILICNWHHQRAVKDLQQLPTLDRDLSRALVPVTSGVRPWSSSHNDDPGIDLDVHVFEARDYIRNALANLIGYVVTERGLHLRPEGTVVAMARFLTNHAEWMSANPVTATTWPRQIANLRAEARRRAYRSRQTAIKLGICPMTNEEGAPCGTDIRHDPSDYAGQNVTCRGCGTTGTVDWWQTVIWGDGQLLAAGAVAALLTTRYNRIIPPETIRGWASKGIIEKTTDATGRSVYDIGKVRAHADTIWQLPKMDQTA